MRRTFQGAGALALAPVLAHCGGSSDFDYSTVPQTSNFGNLGALQDPDANGLRLPAGFTSRIIARSGQPVEGTSYEWHGSPDGAATFPLSDGGYIYTSNSELIVKNTGGAGAIRFDRNGRIRDAYSILTGTTNNCGGGPTPWGTWMSAEENSTGQVHECDPHGELAAIAWPALGRFTHEAIAFDPATMRAYLTEDRTDGRFYRFTPAAVVDGKPDLSSGTLEAMRVVTGIEGAVVWEPIPDPAGSPIETRLQAPTSTAFNGGEGIWCFGDIVYFTTKGDNRLWAHDIGDSTLTIVYDDDDFVSPILRGVDNIYVTASGDVLVCEDGDDMQVIVITPTGSVLPIAQVVGQASSEITGIALDPHRRRLYFSSQRGENGNLFTGGITYEVEGPFFI